MPGSKCSQGHAIPRGATFCPVCGERLEAVEDAARRPAPRPRWLPVTLVAAVVLTAVGVAMAVANGHRGASGASPPSAKVQSDAAMTVAEMRTAWRGLQDLLGPEEQPVGCGPVQDAGGLGFAACREPSAAMSAAGVLLLVREVCSYPGLQRADVTVVALEPDGPKSGMTFGRDWLWEGAQFAVDAESWLAGDGAQVALRPDVPGNAAHPYMDVHCYASDVTRSFTRAEVADADVRAGADAPAPTLAPPGEGECDVAASGCAFDNGIDVAELREEIDQELSTYLGTELAVNCDVGPSPPNRVAVGETFPCEVTEVSGAVSGVTVTVTPEAPFYQWDSELFFH